MRFSELMLRRELQSALELATHGKHMTPFLAGDLKTVARSILLRHGLDRAQVHVSQAGPNGFSVTVVLPPGPARVEQIVLHIGQSW